MLSKEKFDSYSIKNVVTFYSYKGGVGRTTSLALTASYLARSGKSVFILDCDFEAPGLINFFNTSQTETPKNGIIEYFNDTLFDSEINLEEYIISVDKEYSGEGSISLMAAGNIASTCKNDMLDYIEGLARIDLHGLSLVKKFKTLIDEINEKYNPDVIMIDSRTGFNNIFGALAKISNHVVILSGDDIQNQPGLSYAVGNLKETDASISFVLSIISNNYSRRFSNFEKYVTSNFSSEADVFYFDRQNTLECIGTSFEEKRDVEDFITGENGSSQYHKFFNHLSNIVSVATSNTVTNDILPQALIELNIEPSTEVPSNSSDELKVDIKDVILNEVSDKLPNLYAENIIYTDDYVNKFLFIRPCMEDFFIPEKTLLLGDKGTGKTAFYQALRNNNFFKKLEERTQKKHLNYTVFNITNFENDNFEILGFDDFQKDELFIKKFWIFYIWNALCSRKIFETHLKSHIIDLSKAKARDEIVSIVNNSELHSMIEDDLISFSSKLKSNDKRLIITFDRLDNIVKPYMWNDIITPLVKLCMRFPYINIIPKLFMRRDLYDRLGNLTNKSSFESRAINLEWSQNEMFSYFLKIVFTACKKEFFEYLNGRENMSPIFLEQVRAKLKSKTVEHNQLPLDTHIIQPIINIFFGEPKPRKNGLVSTAYEDLYRNIQSADKTVNLRPFLDLMTNAIKHQKEQDSEKQFRKEAIIGLAYCTSKLVRKAAVVNYLEDLWNEQGNEFVKYFCEYFSKNEVESKYRNNSLHEHIFENLLLEIKSKNDDVASIKQSTLDELKKILVASKIVTPYMVGNKTRYAFAYLYTNYLGI